MNVEVNYDDKVEQKNTHPKLLPEVIESMSTKSVELLAKSRVTGASHKKRNSNSTVVPAIKQVTFKEEPQSHRRSVLSVVQIAKLKKRIDESRKVCSVERNGKISERLRSNNCSRDRLLKH